MSFPEFLQRPASNRSRTATAVTPLPAAGGAAPSLGRTVAYIGERQKQSNWCWAAVATSIAHSYGDNGWSQCDVADATLGRKDCCGTGAANQSKCNRPYYLESALQTTGHLFDMEARALTFAEVEVEVDKGRAIGCRVGWRDGTGHFLAVVGYSTGASGRAYIEIDDPIFLTSRSAFDEFASLYQGGGDWTHSYLTEPAPAAVALASMGGQAPLRHPDAIGG